MPFNSVYPWDEETVEDAWSTMINIYTNKVWELCSMRENGMLEEALKAAVECFLYTAEETSELWVEFQIARDSIREKERQFYTPTQPRLLNVDWNTIAQNDRMNTEALAEGLLQNEDQAAACDEIVKLINDNLLERRELIAEFNEVHRRELHLRFLKHGY